MTLPSAIHDILADRRSKEQRPSNSAALFARIWLQSFCSVVFTCAAAAARDIGLFKVRFTWTLRVVGRLCRVLMDEGVEAGKNSGC